MKCPKCGQSIETGFFYCPTCGVKLKEKPVSANSGDLTKLFLLSWLLPPFGLPMTIRFIRSPEAKARTAGWISLAGTILILGLATWWTTLQINRLTEEMNRQLNGYGNLLW